jgi:hypothetical protein
MAAARRNQPAARQRTPTSGGGMKLPRIPLKSLLTLATIPASGTIAVLVVLAVVHLVARWLA